MKRAIPAVLLLGWGLAGMAGGQKAPLFEHSDQCMACHNGLTASSGEDISIGFDWRASMMANSARDPYWQAGVRREIMDHPAAREAIEHECSICHMPMTNFQARAAGGKGEIFAFLPFDSGDARSASAADGVSCTVCHRISPENFGAPESFTGHFVIAGNGERQAFGAREVDAGRAAVMRSATGFTPTEAEHIQQSELCATCHTLYTTALGPEGKVIARLPEQVPYLEWLHSDYRRRQSCQDCHMERVRGEAALTSVLGQPREGVARHVFVGGNFFVPRMLNRFRQELSVVALPQELEAAAMRTLAFLQNQTARMTIDGLEVRGSRLVAEVAVENLGGHKLPTAYPSRRVWLHVVVRDRDGRAIFESGALTPQGEIVGNDNDADPKRYEPHYAEINGRGQVQIYESVMADATGAPTTGLLRGVRYLKDNRLLPHGFDKSTASDDIAVVGAAAGDGDFVSGGDRVRYVVELGEAQGPYHVEAALWYQPISFRWAKNLEAYEAPEPLRFTRYYRSMADSSAVLLTRSSRSAR